VVIVNLPDGNRLQFETPLSVGDVARRIGPGLAKAALAAEVDGRLVDLTHVVDGEVRLTIVTRTNAHAVELLRHSCAHILATAVQRLYPGTQFGIGPAIENGFYYDFDIPGDFSVEALPRIEEEMNRIIAEDTPFVRSEMSRNDALSLFKSQGQLLKAELVGEIVDDVVSVYKNGDFVDFCRGPHIPSTGKAPAFKLTSVAGAYWRGDVHNKMLQRVYGVAFADPKELKAHLDMLEEAKKRDHRRIGKDMDLFSMQDEGPGFPFFHPRGAALINQVVGYWRDVHRSWGYQEVITPTILNRELWLQSGHYDNYKEHMYFCNIDEKEYAVKPMNCPGAMLIYKTRVRSYRELPLRYAEMGRVHRHELSGVMHGLFRVRAFSIDDAHIFCTPEQIEDEVIGVMDLLSEIYRTFGFMDWKMTLSTKPAKAIGSDEIWETATNALRNALARKGLTYDVEEGGGAFYGPKIDVKVVDSIGRLWQCGTVQVDFSMPARFNLEYTGPDSKLHTPVLVHRAILGSLERFLGILIEHTAGKFPLWLAPVQARVMTVTDGSRAHGELVEKQLAQAGLRVDGDYRGDKIGYKIRSATMENVPYMLIIGENEAASGKAALRHRTAGDLGPKDLDEILNGLRAEVGSRSLVSFWDKR